MKLTDKIHLLQIDFEIIIIDTFALSRIDSFGIVFAQRKLRYK